MVRYHLHGVVAQAIKARDRFGRRYDQPASMSRLEGREEIVIRQTSPGALALERSGRIVAVVREKSSPRSGRARTELRSDGSLARDDGKLGGIFLFPLPFLATHSINGGAELHVGDRFTQSLGTKLFGMRAPPRVILAVGAESPAGDTYMLTGSGAAPMKEFTVAADGTALGYASGTAHLTLSCDYDRRNLRARALTVDVRDTLRLTDASHRTIGTVKDTQHYRITLER